MKRTKYILLFIGIAVLAAAVFGLIKGDPFMDHLITIICGASLIFGYVQLKNNASLDS